MYFEPPPDPSPAEVRERVREQWHDRAQRSLGVDTTGLPSGVVDAIATQIRAAVTQRAGTNGHCYGMVLSAQAYFEDPESIPVDEEIASEIAGPTVPFESPDAPVYEEIVRRQADQFLRFRPWLARRAILRPEWLDQTAVIDDVRSVVEATGSASVVLFGDSLLAHQVLVHRVERRDGGVELGLYDPNRSAGGHRRNPPTIRFDREEDRLRMRPYDDFTGLLYTRYDQIEQASDRARAGPLDHLAVDADRLRDELLPVAQVAVDSTDVALSVIEPSGDRSRRIRGRFDDRSRGSAPRLRTCYGADSGSYRIRLLATADTTYELRTVVAGADRTRLEAIRSGAMDAGGVREYALTVGAPTETAVQRVDLGRKSGSNGRLTSPLVAAGVGAVAGAAIGGGAVALGRRGGGNSEKSLNERDR
ncbi:hypothetical protein [Halobaculum magnesiiphilum]|uniref:Uncharacterized protein n=1 Tax=Halobaculum magnesiiphilum TaxID=1017351 RepID=A0A8T8WI06_9EURY|nr:hypothetical protein [Halobaculum magnesiiphilum]QZP39502.1 hypothetical protein K6T50_18160 [Halobaculum magnesiiphilum]